MITTIHRTIKPSGAAKSRLAVAAPTLLFALGLILLSGCDKEGENEPVTKEDPYQRLSNLSGGSKKGKAGADADLSPEQLHAKQLASIKEMQEKALKAQEEKIKKLKTKDAKPEKAKPGDAVARAIPKNDQKLLEVEPPKKGSAKNKILDISRAEKNADAIEIEGPKGSIRTPAAGAREAGSVNSIGTKHTNNKHGGSTIDMSGKANAESIIGSGSVPEIKDPPKKRGMMDRIFGRNKPPGQVLAAAGKDERLKVGNTDLASLVRSNADSKDTLSHRVQSAMAIKRLEKEMKDRGETGLGGVAKNAEVVDLDSGSSSTPTPAPASTPDAFIANPETAPVNAAVAEKIDSEEEIKSAAENQYRTGLGSRDVFARQGAYMRAEVERREDAIPYLLEEIRQNNILASQAAQALGGIGKLTDDVEITLIRGLGMREAGVRQTCAESLGRLRSRRAVQPIVETLKTEKSYQVRSAYLNALGAIGERSAIPALKAKLEQGDEIAPVKSHAALALARLGDPSGRAHLMQNLDSRDPALQVLGLMGVAQLHEPFVAGYLNTALESGYDEVWTTAVYLFPHIGPGMALPILRTRLDSPNETLRRRAALAMGFLGSDEAVPYIDRAVRVGTLQERAMGCELLASLARNDKVPLLIEKLQDPHTNVRQLAAISLTRLNAREAVPDLVEATRGLRNANDLPPALRGGGIDPMERLVMLSCVRILRGEKDDLVITSLPNMRDNTWPEVDRVLAEQRVELLKLYQVVDVVSANKEAIGVVIKSPDGKEILYKPGEAVAAGFRVREIGQAYQGKDKSNLPPYVILMKGDERVTLIAGKPAEVDSKRNDRK